MFNSYRTAPFYTYDDFSSGDLGLWGDSYEIVPNQYVKADIPSPTFTGPVQNCCQHESNGNAAFFESDIPTLIDIGTAALPKGSRFGKTVEKMKSLHKKYPDNWQQARKAMSDEFWHNESPDTKTIWNANLNGAAGILALLYGEGDFQKTQSSSNGIKK